MQVRFHPAAREELEAAGEWYDEHLPGLSAELFDAVQDALDLIVERPLAWQQPGEPDSGCCRSGGRHAHGGCDPMV